MSLPSDAETPAWRQAWLGPRPELYRPECWGARSTDIAVRELRFILILPLVLREPHRLEDVAAAFHAVADWQSVTDLADHAAPANSDGSPASGEQASRYAEFVYFHDFVQQILFKADANGPGEPVRLFRHKRVAGFSVTVNQDDVLTHYSGKVDRALIYLFGSGSAAFVAELRFPDKSTVSPENGPPRHLSLADTLWLSDQIRRTYAPYFRVTGTKTEAGGVPVDFTWYDLQGEPAFPNESVGDLEDAFRFTFRVSHPRTAPMFPHWRKILAPLTIAGYGKGEGGAPVWRHVVDDRIPLMSYVSLTGAAASWAKGRDDAQGDQLRNLPSEHADLHMVNRGDWVRLCCADPAGPAKLPYNPDFLRNFETEACYDRFFPSEAIGEDVSSRIMFAGYHMNMTGAGGFFDDVMVDHFRRHYFQMGLVVNMELASMLAISSRITETTKTYVAARNSGEGKQRLAAERFRRAMAQIERDFLELTHLYMFRGLSNQVQPMELYALWRRQLNLDALYDDLKGELDAAIKVVQTDDETERSERSMHLGQTANALALLATFGVVAGIITGLLGINFLVTSDLCAQFFSFLRQHLTGQGGMPVTLGPSGNLAVVGAVVSLTSFLGCGMLRFVVSDLQRTPDPDDAVGASQSVGLAKVHASLKWVGWIACGITIIAAGMACLS